MTPARLALFPAAGLVLSGGAPGWTGALAAAAALSALREARFRDAGIAAGLAAGLSPAGLALLPVLLGTAIAHRSVRSMLTAFIPALLITLVLFGWNEATVDMSVWRFDPGMDLRGLLAATAIGLAAWITAGCAARRPLPAEIDAATLLAAATLPLLLPLGLEAIAPVIALALAGVRPALPARGANDNPLAIRATPA